jgi:hypothetical protein
VIHDITAGHFDLIAILERRETIDKPIDLRVVLRLLRQLGETDDDGSPTLGGAKVRFEDGCVILPWLGGRTNHVAEEFAIRLHRETGCTLVDREHGRLINPAQLTGLPDARRHRPIFARARRFMREVEKGWKGG